MTTQRVNTKELFTSLNETTSTFSQLISSFAEEDLNTVPYENSWTAAQVAEHVALSNQGMIQSLNKEGRQTQRDIEEGVPKLKEIFLNFGTKLQSPKFILPTKDKYNKESVISDFKNSVDRLNQLRNTVDLSESIDHNIFGDITKLEMLHFVVYHTQRHIHQLKKIYQAIQQNKNQQQQKQNTMTQNNITQINPYISFNGKCREAMTFYKDCLGGELTMQRLGDSPMPCPKGTEDQIMHSSLTRNGTVLLMATDMTGNDGFHKGNNISLSLNCSSEEEIKTFFSKLSEGGTVLDTLKDQFWGAIFGMLTDRFGIVWMLNYNKNPQP